MGNLYLFWIGQAQLVLFVSSFIVSLCDPEKHSAITQGAQISTMYKNINDMGSLLWLAVSLAASAVSIYFAHRGQTLYALIGATCHVGFCIYLLIDQFETLRSMLAIWDLCFMVLITVGYALIYFLEFGVHKDDLSSTAQNSPRQTDDSNPFADFDVEQFASMDEDWLGFVF